MKDLAAIFRVAKEDQRNSSGVRIKKRKKEEERISGVRIAALRKSTSASAASGKSKSSPSSMKKMSKPGSGGIQSKIGSFDGGMLKLSAKDLAKIKGQKKQK